MLVLDGPPQPIYALAFTPDGRFLAVGAKEGSPWLWDECGAKHEFDQPLTGFEAGVTSIAYSPSGESSAVGGPAGWRGVTTGAEPDGKVFGPTGSNLSPVTTLRFLTDGLIAVGSGHRAKPMAGRFELWDLATNRRREPHFPAQNGVRAIAVQPGGGAIAWAERSGEATSGPRLTVWDVRKPDPTRLSLSHPAVSIAFHPDGETLAAASEWGVRVYDLKRKHEKFHLKGHTGTVSAVEYSPDGRVLASSSWDGTVRYWEPGTGREAGCFRCPVGKIFAMTFSPDGLRLAAGGDAGGVAMWDLD